MTYDIVPILTQSINKFEKIQWECFCDMSYYGLWAVRPVGDRDFNSQQLFHVQSQQEAQSLACLLNSLVR